MPACICCCTDAISCDTKTSRRIGSHPGIWVKKRGSGGHAWGCTQERCHSPRAGTGCQGAPAPVGARLLSCGLAAASSPRCMRLSGQECRHGHTSHCHTINPHLGGAAHGLKDAASMAFSEKAAQQSLLRALLHRSNGMAHTQDTVASHRRHKAQTLCSQSSLAPAEHAQRGLRASAGGACLQAGGLHGSPSQSCTASGPSRRCVDGCAGCVALHAPALLCCAPAQQLLAPVHVQEMPK